MSYNFASTQATYPYIANTGFRSTLTEAMSATGYRRMSATPALPPKPEPPFMPWKVSYKTRGMGGWTSGSSNREIIRNINEKDFKKESEMYN